VSKRAGNMPAPVDAPRSASVQLRTGKGQSDGMMDPANQSLADALRITYRVVQAAMVVLAALFVFSGVQRVGEGESGIPLFLGKPTAAGELSPGAHFSAPFPLGEIVKVDATSSNLDVMRTYWPLVAEGSEEMAVDKLQPLAQIDPGRDGSLVTADLNLAHAQWKVEYRRTDPRKYAQNILPEDEEAIVGGAVKSGIVRVVAEVSIDSLLKQTESDEFSVAARVQSIAQDQLDRIGSGIHIGKVTLYRVTAPSRLRNSFEGVLAAASMASTMQERAKKEGDATLSRVAGLATADLAELIQYYETAVELGEVDRAARLMDAINDVFEGRAVVFEDISVPASMASGEVTEIISSARTKAITLRESAEADLRIFKAKVAQFEANPKLMMFRDWVSAYNAFTNKPYVQTEILPAGTAWQMVLNADPEIAKEIYRNINLRKTEETQRKRFEEIEKRRFEIDEDMKVEG
jgi:modulator of FtsH protease HflK